MSSQPQEVDVVDVVIEFLEVSIHHLLFLRNLYPASIFVPRKMYNVPVQVSKHPGVNEYISESLRSVRALLRRKHLKGVCVCFYDDSQIPIERFVFDLLDIEENFRIGHDFSDAYLLQLRDGFRAFTLKLAAADMKPLCEQSTFQIHICTTERGSHTLASDPAFQDFPWINLEERENELTSPSLVPLRTIESDFLKLQIYRETAS